MLDSEMTREIGRKGRAIYDEKLKAVLEPEHNNEFVVIHVDNGDYAVARRRWDATEVMHGRYGIDGRLLAMRIGQEPEYALASRVVATEGAKPAARDIASRQ